VGRVREQGFGDGVLAVGGVRGGDRFGVVGEERVVAPDGERLVGVGAVADPPDVGRAVISYFVPWNAV
jgi:hypothetical protein